MQRTFSELIDIPRLQRLTDLFHKATGIPASVIDLEGTVLTGSGWQEICTDFHRRNAGAARRCMESDTIIANKVAAGQVFTVYRCKNGLIDAAAPITIEGEHVANFFTGQFLFEPPDPDYFREQAKHFGFDETPYMEAAAKIPVIEEARLQPFLEYFSEFAAMVGEMGLKQLKQVEATDALRESEQRWATTLASIGDAVIATDKEGRITFMNRVAEELTGWTLAEADARPVTGVFSIINEYSRETVENPISRVLREGTIVGLANHTILLRKDGAEIFVDDSGAPIRDTDGTITGAVLVFRDITERRKAEERANHLASFPEMNPNPVLEVDGEGKITFCSPGTFAMLNDLDLSKDCALFLPDDFAEILEAWDKKKETTVRRDVRLGGRVFEETIHLFPRFGVARIYAFDVTDRKEAEEKLHRAKEEWERTFDSVPDAIAIIDDQHRILRVNEAMARRVGLKADQCVGLRCYEAVHGLSEPPDFCPHSKTLKDGLEHVATVHEERLGGHFLVSTVPLRDGEGRMIGTVHVAHDITERKQAEEALRKAHDELEIRVRERTAELQRAYDSLIGEIREREQLQVQLRQAQKMEALGTLSGGIAHDFNNLLAAIIGFTELVAGHVAEGSRDERHLKRVMEASLRGRELVKQMLTFSRNAEQEKKPLWLSGIVKETMRLLRASIPTTISIKASVRSESALILGDPTQIQQVLMNLCMNAAHAMGEKGGVLDVELSDFSVSPLHPDPHGVEPGLYMKLTVRDTGTGIPAEIMDKLFDPFFTTKKPGEGTGLGLSVVHGIVRQSKGYITVESEPGTGSTFTVYFPKASEGPIAEAAVDEEVPTGDERVLFVDDEEALVEMGEDILAELGYEVMSRTSSREALELLEEDPRRFDLIITDQTMPELTGIELAGEALLLRPDMPIIMCTGFSQLVDADKARKAGIRAFVMKPLTRREIAKTIRQVLDR